MAPASEESPHILVADDDERIRTLLQRFLMQSGFTVTVAQDAAHVKRLLAGLQFDLIVLDIMMPGQDGVSLTRELLGTGAPPIILLSAKSGTDDRIVGLEAGSDDYMPKPFDPQELVLRIRAILRRTPPEGQDSAPKALKLGGAVFRSDRLELWRGDQNVPLTSAQQEIMRVLSSSPNRPVSRADLAAVLGGSGAQIHDRAVDVQISRLRQKIEENPAAPRYIKSVRGIGYALEPDG